MPGKLRVSSFAVILLLAVTIRVSEASADEGPVERWFATSDGAKESQPHWMTPVITVTPRLEQELRYDQTWQQRPGNVTLDSYGGKGIELIPASNVEMIIGLPAYEVRESPRGRTAGWADEPLLLKFRLASGNEEHGNYIVTGFLGVSLPVGGDAFSNRKSVITPSLAAGKGWGNRNTGFDIQSTLGIAIPTGDSSALGRPVTWNTAFQGHLGRLWPEVETTYTYFHGGPNDGKSQTALTAGIVLGRFQVNQRVRLIIGGGYQWVVSSFRTFNDAWLLTARAAF
ncbi:MAG TPA: hypothetical protein VN730_08435 [Steroidobacteraceae bacterium]|nr:hypothetical protein [Steroidobacteraceae bacterium]